MDTLSAFVNDISSFQIGVPLWVKIGVILVLLISLLVGAYFVKDTFSKQILHFGHKLSNALFLHKLTIILLIALQR